MLVEYKPGYQIDRGSFLTLSVNRRKEGEGFSARFQRALASAPNKGIFWENGGWTPLFLKGIERVEKACKERNICAHGVDHLTQVAKNAFTLIDSVGEGQVKSVSDGEIVFPVLAHDMGYGLKSVFWKGNHAVDHAEKGAKFIERFRVRTLPHMLGSGHESLRVVSERADVYFFTIAADSRTMLQMLHEIPHGEATSEALLPASVMVADKLDYFRRARVEGIPHPEYYEQNPYVFLADSVKTYDMKDGKDSIQFQVTLDTDKLIPTVNGYKRFNFETWQSETEKEYPMVWSLARAYARAVNKDFTVSEKSTTSYS